MTIELIKPAVGAPSHTNDVRSGELAVIPEFSIQKPPKHFLSRSWLKAASAILSIFFIAVFLTRNILFGTPVDAYPVTMGPLRQSIVASSRVIWPQRVSIAAEVIGRVSLIPVIEGQMVKHGQLLIKLEDKDERAANTQATMVVKQAEAKLRQQREVSLPTAQQGLAQAQEDFDELSRQLTRMQQLKVENYVSQAELDTAMRNFNIASSKLDSAKLQVETYQPNGSDEALAMSSFKQAQASLKMTQVKLDQDSIVAPADGVLINRGVEPGDIVQPGKELMVLAAKGDTQLEAQIDEKNLAKISIGQHALGSADAFPNQRFDATVVYINPGVDATRGSVKIKLLVNKPPAYLKQDMTVSVDIETAKRSDALVIPTGALRDASSDAPWVLVVRNHRTVHQPVTMGLRGDDTLEILSGVKAGESVILATSGLIKAGQRVRVYTP